MWMTKEFLRNWVSSKTIDFIQLSINYSSQINFIQFSFHSDKTCIKSSSDWSWSFILGTIFWSFCSSIHRFVNFRKIRITAFTRNVEYSRRYNPTHWSIHFDIACRQNWSSLPHFYVCIWNVVGIHHFQCLHSVLNKPFVKFQLDSSGEFILCISRIKLWSFDFAISRDEWINDRTTKG